MAEPLAAQNAGALIAGDHLQLTLCLPLNALERNSGRVVIDTVGTGGVHPRKPRPISLQSRLEQTKRQREDVAGIIEKLGAKPESHECQAMKELIKEGQELLEKKGEIDADVMDAGLIAAAQRVEHYEIAG